MPANTTTPEPDTRPLHTHRQLNGSQKTALLRMLIIDVWGDPAQGYQLHV